LLMLILPSIAENRICELLKKIAHFRVGCAMKQKRRILIFHKFCNRLLKKNCTLQNENNRKRQSKSGLPFFYICGTFSYTSIIISVPSVSEPSILLNSIEKPEISAVFGIWRSVVSPNSLTIAFVQLLRHCFPSARNCE